MQWILNRCSFCPGLYLLVRQPLNGQPECCGRGGSSFSVGPDNDQVPGLLRFKDSSHFLIIAQSVVLEASLREHLQQRQRAQSRKLQCHLYFLYTLLPPTTAFSSGSVFIDRFCFSASEKIRWLSPTFIRADSVFY